MRADDLPKPYFETKLKVRWDDERLYIGAYMQETDFWGTLTEDESKIWWENSFIAYIIPDNSMHNYKEMQINVLNATWDLLVKKPFIDTDCHIRVGNQCPADEDTDDSSWFSDQVKKIYTDGGINDPSQRGTFWSVEWSFTFEALSNHTDRLQPKPKVGETWFANFLRAQYHVKVENGTYVQDMDAGYDGWAWQPTYDEDPHFPETFGLVQFKNSLEDKQFLYERWHLYKALFQVFNAQKKNRILKREYNMDLYKTEVAPFVLSNMCADVRMVSASDDAFEATAKSRMDSSLPIAHIREDRYVWFTSN